jgi:superfamily II DNA or RNA helicase
METLTTARGRVQSEALKAWTKFGQKGTIEVITGLGKTKIAMTAIKKLPKDAKILFLAEVKDRELELGREQEKWRAKDWDITFSCYQSAYKWKDTEWDLVIADEIHDSLTPVYSRFYRNNKYKSLMGLSATIDERAIVEEVDEVKVTKGELLKKIAPVCYTYDINDGQVEGTARPLAIYVIRHKLDIYTKNVVAGNKFKKWYQTEFGAYAYKDMMFRRATGAPSDVRERRIHVASAARAKLLYNLESKVGVVKKLLNNIPGRTILFGNSLETLEKVTPNVISSHKNDKENKQIREDFDNGDLDLIAAFKKLKQGANLKDLDNCVIMSYYSKEKDLIQRVGRLRNNGEIGRIFILVTANTQEEVWYKRMTESLNEDNLSIINCVDIEDCLAKIK